MKRSIFLLTVIAVFVLCFGSLAFAQETSGDYDIAASITRGDWLEDARARINVGEYLRVLVYADLYDGGGSSGYVFQTVNDCYTRMRSTPADIMTDWTDEGTRAQLYVNNQVKVTVVGYLEVYVELPHGGWQLSDYYDIYETIYLPNTVFIHDEIVEHDLD